MPKPKLVEHVDPHFFLGVCICPCKVCTAHKGDTYIQCICTNCPSALCGLVEPKRISGNNVVA